MAKRVVVVVTDDMDGGDAAETVSYALDGVGYEIDLNEGNAARLRESLHRFVKASRRVSGRSERVMARGPRTANGQVPTSKARTDREQGQAIRAWAKREGLPVTDRGRVPREIVDKYHATAGRRQ